MCFECKFAVVNISDLDLCLPIVVSLLRDLKHANIVTLHDIIHTDSCLTLVFEYLVRVNLLLLHNVLIS